MLEVEDLHQPRARLLGVVARADDLDDLVDVEDRDQEALDQVQPFLAARQAVLGASGDHADAVIEVDAKQFAQAEGLRSAVDQGDVVDAEAVFERGVPVELLENGLRAESGLDADDEPQAVRAVAEVGDVRDAGQLLGVDAVLDLLDHLFGPDEIGQFGDDQAALACSDALDADLGAGLEAAAAGRVGVANAGEADDRAARRAGRARARTP